MNRARRQRPVCKSRGFTLVEVLVALVVVALGLTALMVAVNGIVTGVPLGCTGLCLALMTPSSV